MKVARIHQYGHSDKVRIENIPAPAIRQGEALVRVRAAAVNPVDWKIREGMLGGDKKALPLILGQDFSGVIEKVEETIEELTEEQALEPGDEVFGTTTGAYAEYVVMPLQELAMKPRSLSFEQAASISTPALTAWQALFEVARVEMGQKILIHGASGGVGSIAVQLCKWKGLYVAATASGEGVKYVQELGADVVIDHQRDSLQESMAAKEFDVVLDPIGGETQKYSLGLMKKNGVLVNLVHDVNKAKAQEAGVRAEVITMRYDVSQLIEIAHLYDEKILKARVARVFPFEKVREAQDLNQSGHPGGKIVLKLA